ncbi:MAG: TetR/AcrR family transcriptional regulator [Flavobacteriales bacterium]|nr:TetR/AcrR family transcriptional regulator [Flavobacteriales bacterium]MBK6944738.1 TetR/AcrR family transcriptional regulator [Flavobacteriales bacterium]MBK7241115.1 TetR/AcrR family transcriptional regulator [Flavobacteriales bacterium]MBK7295740.1 TetR/AcrR family transcriptional regulator [Flavobacteriales bacterium]MBK9534393.1 TetR/AcrR family transcriptional regulator [Flavobacteriales bacterium]
MVHYQLAPDTSLHLRDPAASAVGGRILSEGLALMNELGLEAFTFRKLADRAECTEATIYNYFTNKQRLLQYYFQLYWMWLDTHCQQEGHTLTDPWARVQGDIHALCGIWSKDALAAQLDPVALRDLVLVEGSKSFMHRNVDEDNKLKLFQPYKDLCSHLAKELKACDRSCKHPRTFATTLIEMAHSLEFAMDHLPALTELSGAGDRRKLAGFLIGLTSVYLAIPAATGKKK